MISQLGFSIVEMMVAMSIFTVVSAAILSVVASSQRNWANDQRNNEKVWQGQAVIAQMVRELRMAGYPARNSYAGTANITPSNSNLVADTFLTANSTQVIFEADLNGDGSVERVEYRLNGTTLERSAVTKNSDGSVPAAQYQTLAENVNNGATAIFTYTTDPYSGWSSPRNRIAVQVQLHLRTKKLDPKDLAYRTYLFTGVARRQNPER